MNSDFSIYQVIVQDIDSWQSIGSFSDHGIAETVAGEVRATYVARGRDDIDVYLKALDVRTAVSRVFRFACEVSFADGLPGPAEPIVPTLTQVVYAGCESWPSNLNVPQGVRAYGTSAEDAVRAATAYYVAAGQDGTLDEYRRRVARRIARDAYYEGELAKLAVRTPGPDLTLQKQHVLLRTLERFGA
jgi:hypothetical protein